MSCEAHAKLRSVLQGSVAKCFFPDVLQGYCLELCFGLKCVDRMHEGGLMFDLFVRLQ